MAQKDVALSWFVLGQPKSEINSLHVRNVKLSCLKICQIEMFLVVNFSPLYKPPLPLPWQDTGINN